MSDKNSDNLLDYSVESDEEAGEEYDSREEESRIHYGYREDEGDEGEGMAGSMLGPKSVAASSMHAARTTLYDLESVMTTFSQFSSVKDNGESARYSASFGVPGVARINLSELTQKIIGCVVDENVTTEYPWKYVRKEIIEDNLDLHSESSDFLPVREEIEEYPGPEMLVGYAPSTYHKGQFYICVTPESHATVVSRIEALRLEQQERVKNAVVRLPGEWCDQGSSQLIDQAIPRKTRPLFEIEVESTVDLLRKPISLTDRASDNQRDGYVELVPYRETFNNVMKVLVDKEAKVVPVTKENEAQTPISHKVNFWAQCSLDREAIKQPEESSNQDLGKFLESLADEVCDQVLVNTKWDMYANDYAKLAIHGESEARKAGDARYVERQSYFDAKLSAGRVINDVSWHPTWSGIAAAAYTSTAKSETCSGPRNRDIDTNGMVLVWSLDDCLKPKLILESKREVTCVSFCPHNSNIVVGGCCNGQVVIWDITGKIEEVETVVVRTAAQVKHATIIKGLSSWMKESRGFSRVIPTATSSLQYSQNGPITKLQWLPPYIAIDTQGRLQKEPVVSEENEPSLQCVSASEDGSIAFWDLNWRPTVDKKVAARSKKKTLKQPESLVQSISPFKVLDGVFKPTYMLIIQYENIARNMVVTSMNLCTNLPDVEQIKPFPQSNDITERRFFRVIIKDGLVPDGIFVGTSTGECGLVTWEGFEFSTGVTVNKEVCKWIWRKQLHDGPISQAVRSCHLNNLVLTIGGRIFAVWRRDFEEPLFWRKSEYRYTACSWDSSKSTIIILGRNDGTIEIWDISIKTYEPTLTQSLSGKVITGIFVHKLPLNPQCVGIGDYNGSFRMFFTPKILFEFRQSDINWLEQFVEREVDRIKNFKIWQKNIQRSLAEEGQEQQDSKAKADEKQEATEDRRDENAGESKKPVQGSKAKARKQLVEEMRARWVTRELQRMERAILTKKGLREEELERRIAPVLKLKEEVKVREERRRRILDRVDEFFEDELAASFPQHKQKLMGRMRSSTTSEIPDRRSIPSQPIGDYARTEDDVIHQYEELQSEALASLRTDHDTDFSWRNLILEGMKRRKSLDIKMREHRRRQIMPMKPLSESDEWEIGSRMSMHDSSEGREEREANA